MSTEQTDATMVALMAAAERYREHMHDADGVAREGLRIVGDLERRLREIRDLHQPEHPDGRQWCRECWDWWPCQTYRLAAGQ